MEKIWNKERIRNCKITLQGFIDNEDYRKAIELIANDEDFDATVQIVPKNNKNERTIFAVSQKSKKGNRVFKSEYTISTFGLNDLPEFYIDSISCISVLDLQVKENTN